MIVPAINVQGSTSDLDLVEHRCSLPLIAQAIDTPQETSSGAILQTYSISVGAVPNVTTYNAVFSACEKAQIQHRALGLLAAAQVLDFVPNAITYSAAITSYVTVQQ